MRILAIDDETHARRELCRLIARQRPGWQVMEAATLEDGVRAIEQHNPSVVFLDVEIPEGDGFSLLEQKASGLPPVVITSGVSDHALRAFDFHALDYLLKPVRPDRLAAALSRVEDYLRKDALHTGGDILHLEDRVLITDQGRCWFLSVQQIACIESEGNYSRLIGPLGNPMVPKPLDYFEERLDPKVFFRANRQVILNVCRIESVQRKPNGQFTAEVKSIGTVEFSRRQSMLFRQRFGF